MAMKTCIKPRLLACVIVHALLFVVFLCGANASPIGAEAVSVLVTLDFEFVLTDEESVEIGPPAGFALPIVVGNAGGDFGEVGVQANFPLGEVFGPENSLDPDGDFAIHIFNGPVSAFADPPPVSFALFIQEITGFFTFRNYSENPTDISLFWNATYFLDAQGDFSSSAINVTANITVGDQDSFDKILISDQQINDGTKFVNEPTDGSNELVIPLLGATKKGDVKVPFETELKINASLSAEALVVPEPSTYALFGTGVLGLLCYGWRRRKKAA